MSRRNCCKISISSVICILCNDCSVICICEMYEHESHICRHGWSINDAADSVAPICPYFTTMFSYVNFDELFWSCFNFTNLNISLCRNNLLTSYVHLICQNVWTQFSVLCFLVVTALVIVMYTQFIWILSPWWPCLNLSNRIVCFNNSAVILTTNI